MEEQKQTFNWIRLLITTVIVLVAAGATAGTTYYVLSTNFQKERTANEKALSDLTKTNKETSNASTKNTTPTQASNPTETLASNAFDFASATITKKYGAMTLLSVEPVDTTRAATESNFRAIFSGRTTVKVNYTYTDPTQPSMMGEFLQFAVTDTESLKKLPANGRDVWFGTMNPADLTRLKGLLGIGDKGTTGSATVIIDGYNLRSLPAEVFNTATILEVVK